MAIIIVGHSHTVALGLGQPPTDIRPPELVPLASEPVELLGIRHKLPPADDVIQYIIELSAGRDLVLMWQGNYHNSLFLLCPDKPFDFVFSSEANLPLDSSAQLVPESLVSEALRLEIDQIRNVVLTLRAAQPARRFWIVSPPPPKQDDEYILERVTLEAHTLLRATGGDPSNIRVTAASVRLKIWKLYARMHGDLAKELGIGFVSAPPASLNEDGFLLQECWGPDATHANQLYGKRLLEHIQKQLS